MYDNVVIGVQGAGDDRRAIELARRLASPQATLTLAHVSVVSALASEREGLELEIRARGEFAHAFAEQIALAGEGARLLHEHATSVGAGLQAATDRIGADLLVLGSTRHRGLDRLLEGDDVQAALTRTRCAVAVADDAPPDRWPTITRVGVAYDDSPQSSVAVEHAQALAAQVGGRVMPLYIAEPHVYATGFGMVAYPIEDPESVVEAARAHLGAVAGEPVKVIYGDCILELVQFSEHVDVLVCGSRRQGPIRRFVFGSTALALSREAHCPVIIAPPPDHAADSTAPATPSATPQAIAEPTPQS